MIARPDVVPFGGGVPVRISGRLAGAVAVSGATSVQDHEIAERAALAITGTRPTQARDRPERTGPMTADLLIRAARAVTGDGLAADRPLAVAVTSGRIAAVEPLDATTLTGRDVLDLDASAVLMPGLVDSHVHVCEPGNTEWEGFATATRAAAAGGITTLVDMPLDSVPTTVSADALAVKRQAAAGQCLVDVGVLGRRDSRQRRMSWSRWRGRACGASSASWPIPARLTSRP